MQSHLNVCAVIHEEDIATLTMTADQMRMLHTILDIARQDEADDDDTVRIDTADFAEQTYTEVSAALAHHDRLTTPTPTGPVGLVNWMLSGGTGTA